MEAHGRERTQDLVDESRRTHPYLEASFKQTLDFDHWIELAQMAKNDPTFIREVEKAARGTAGRRLTGILEARERLKSLRGLDAHVSN